MVLPTERAMSSDGNLRWHSLVAWVKDDTRSGLTGLCEFCEGAASRYFAATGIDADSHRRSRYPGYAPIMGS